MRAQQEPQQPDRREGQKPAHEGDRRLKERGRRGFALVERTRVDGGRRLGAHERGEAVHDRPLLRHDHLPAVIQQDAGELPVGFLGRPAEGRNEVVRRDHAVSPGDQGRQALLVGEAVVQNQIAAEEHPRHRPPELEPEQVAAAEDPVLVEQVRRQAPAHAHEQAHRQQDRREGVVGVLEPAGQQHPERVAE
ncbi:hypothetical protein D3C72_1652950 [compost metagenome]